MSLKIKKILVCCFFSSRAHYEKRFGATKQAYGYCMKNNEPSRQSQIPDNEYYTGYYKILGVRPHSGEKTYEIQPFLQGEDEELDTLNAYVSDIQWVKEDMQRELERKASEIEAQKASEINAQTARDMQSSPSYRGDVYSASRQLF